MMISLRRHRYLQLFSLLVSSILLVIIVNPDLLTPSYKNGPVRVTQVLDSGQSSASPTILIWDKYFGGDWPPMDIPCNCSISTDRSLFNSSSVVVFHLRDFSIRDVPEYRLQHQKFVMYNLESPCYTKIKKRDFELFEDNIDWAMSYRSDSDIYTPYAEKIELSKEMSYESSSDYLNSNLFKSKTKKVAWFVSNCDTCSNREEFVTALQEFIPVDVYGSCGPLKCRDRSFCYQMLEADHKFYLSFENSMCKEYVTEKVFNLLKYHIIPVVLGPSDDYKKILPENSYIDALNFSTPRALADFLHKVSDSESLYSSFFKWKSSFYFEPMTHASHFCKLCHKLSQNQSPPLNSYRRDLVKWWYVDSQCTSWTRKLATKN